MGPINHLVLILITWPTGLSDIDSHGSKISDSLYTYAATLATQLFDSPPQHQGKTFGVTSGGVIQLNLDGIALHFHQALRSPPLSNLRFPPCSYASIQLYPSIPQLLVDSLIMHASQLLHTACRSIIKWNVGFKFIAWAYLFIIVLLC